jgi:nitrite reductase (NADH) small subunit
MSDVITDRIHIGSVHDIAPGQGRCYVVNGEEIAVFRQRNGSILAIQNRCPHKNGPLHEGIAGGGKVICPMHGHKFDLATGLGSEPRECVRTYKIVVVNDRIEMEAPSPCARLGPPA